MEIYILLTQTAVKKLKFTETRYRKTDYDGLIIEVLPSQSKIWKYRYTFSGKRKMISLGYFPQVGLAEARLIRNDLKAQVLDGLDPSQLKKDTKPDKVHKKKQENEKVELGASFSEVFDEFARRKINKFGSNKPEWGKRTYATHLKRLKKHVFPYFGQMPIKEIDTDCLEKRLLEIQDNGTLETRDKIYTIFRQLFDYAKATRKINENPTIAISKSLFVKKNSKNYKHVTTEHDLKKAIGIIDNLKGSFEVVSCIQISLHIFLRASEVVSLKWNDIDFDLMLITAKTTKSADTDEDKELLIPISKQVERKLREIFYITGHTEYVFKSPISIGHISSGSINKNIRDNGLNDFLTHHGIRHTASTFLNEQDFNSDDIELQLNHKIRGVRGVYNKAKRIEHRRVMMQAWSDCIDSIR